MNFNITKKYLSYFVLFLFFSISFLFFLLDIHFSSLNLLFYGGLFLFSYFFYREKKLIRNYHRDLTLTVFIITISYFIISYLLGVVVGYTRNVYDTSFYGMIFNTLFFIVPLLFREEVRSRFVFFHKSKKATLFITLIFIACEIFSSTFFSFHTNKEFFSQIVTIFLPIVIENVILTYLSYVGIRSTIYAYFLPTLIFRYFMPILVDLDWFYYLLSLFIFSGVLYSFVQNEYLWKVMRIYSRKTDRTNSFLYAFWCFVILFFGLFIAGVFKYQPVAILTYSMVPKFTRGDAVVVEKLKTNAEKERLTKGDVIQYQYNHTMVVHRIIGFSEEDGEKVFILKGDNNNSRDLEAVHFDQIRGKVIFAVPKIGYPSVWLSEFLYPDVDVEVEVGE